MHARVARQDRSALHGAVPRQQGLVDQYHAVFHGRVMPRVRAGHPVRAGADGCGAARRGGAADGHVLAKHVAVAYAKVADGIGLEFQVLRLAAQHREGIDVVARAHRGEPPHDGKRPKHAAGADPHVGLDHAMGPDFDAVFQHGRGVD